MYTEYQVKSITNIIKNKICNNTYSNDNIIVSENSELNKIIYEFDLNTCSFLFTIEHNGQTHKCITKISNINTKIAYSTDEFIDELDTFRKNFNQHLEEISQYFLCLKRNYPNG